MFKTKDYPFIIRGPEGERCFERAEHAHLLDIGPKTKGVRFRIVLSGASVQESVEELPITKIPANQRLVAHLVKTAVEVTFLRQRRFLEVMRDIRIAQQRDRAYVPLTRAEIMLAAEIHRRAGEKVIHRHPATGRYTAGPGFETVYKACCGFIVTHGHIQQLRLGKDGLVQIPILWINGELTKIAKAKPRFTAAEAEKDAYRYACQLRGKFWFDIA